MVDTPSSPHRAVTKNGLDQQQSVKIRDLEHDAKGIHQKLDKNDGDHERIMVILEDILSDIKARKLLRNVMMIVAGAFLAGTGWFVITTMNHVWKGEQWGHELERGIEDNERRIEDLRDLVLRHQLDQRRHMPNGRGKDE